MPQGGLSRWNQLKRVKANRSTTGAIFQVKGKSDVLKDVGIEAQLHKQRLTTHFNGHGTRTIFEPNRIIFETEVGALWIAATIRVLHSGVTREKLPGTICMWRISALRAVRQLFPKGQRAEGWP